jgi:uncharacterized RDD family membrane protein YckC
MNDQPQSVNPFASPAETATATDPHNPESYTLASQGQRFANLFIDGIVYRILGVGVVIAVEFAYYALGNKMPYEGEFSALDVILFTASLLSIILFYVVFEYAFQRTPAKFITGTCVVSQDGSKPSFKAIVIRTLSRLIPFEAFSFLGSDAVGWHDTISKTRVIRNR